MAVKAIITKAVFDALSDALKAEYKAVGDAYHLDIEGASDIPEIKSAKENEKTKRLAAEKRADAAEKKAEELEEAGGDVTKQVEAATKPFKKQVETLTKSNEALRKYVETDLITDKAMALAASISPTPMLLLPHVEKRLKVEFDDDGTPKLVVKGADGNPLEKGLDALKTEFKGNKEYATLITASKASGGGGAPERKTSSGGGAPSDNSQQNDGTTPNLAKLSPSDMAARITARKAAAAEASQT